MTVRDVMSHLLERPPAGTVWRLELFAGKAGERGSKRARSFGDCSDQFWIVGLIDRCIEVEFADGVTQVGLLIGGRHGDDCSLVKRFAPACALRLWNRPRQMRRRND